jgi:fluoroacetyl-CoA thioesterase
VQTCAVMPRLRRGQAYCVPVTLEPGLRAVVKLDVTDADTAIAFRSGDVPVLATPRLAALLEEACVAAIAGQLEPGATSVGMQLQLEHVAPTPVGSVVEAEAVLETVRGRRLGFKVSARDHCGLVCAGRIARVIVDRDRFLGRAHDHA